MALTIDQNNLKRVSEGNKVRILAKVNLDNSYPTGGYLIDPARLGLAQLQSFNVNDQTAGYSYDFDSTTSKLKVLAVGGGGGAAIFTGDPLATHTHGIGVFTETLLQSVDNYVTTISASGFFTVGETITGGTSGATATVSVRNTDPTSDLGFTGLIGNFNIGETITGGTSGTTAIVTTPRFSVFIPSFLVASLIGGRRTVGLDYGRSIASGLDGVPTLNVGFSTLVGTFANNETITGGTSGNTAVVFRSMAGNLTCSQIVWTAGAGFTLGETITGGTSAATAVVTSASYNDFLGFKPISAVFPGGAFSLYFPSDINTPTITVTYVGVNGLAAQSAGTPTGTITGGGGGGPAVEVANATDLSTVVNVEIEATGL
ncbi:MAG: hypothetical protein KA467_00780 [Bacteroidales bacterium]|nr:hypothetical protein [Bacteroidales bacterium]